MVLGYWNKDDQSVMYSPGLSRVCNMFHKQNKYPMAHQVEQHAPLLSPILIRTFEKQFP